MIHEIYIFYILSLHGNYTVYKKKVNKKMSEIILDFEIFELKSSVIKMNENNEKVVSRITE